MMRTISVAKETGQDYAVVTYDLAVALKAYSIQAIESPLFDKMLIMLGNFHIELAFYGAVGTLINQCWSTRTRTRVQLEYTRVLGPYSIKSTRKLDVLGPYSILCTRFLHVLERQVLGTRPQYSRPYSKS